MNTDTLRHRLRLFVILQKLSRLRPPLYPPLQELRPPPVRQALLAMLDLLVLAIRVHLGAPGVGTPGAPGKTGPEGPEGAPGPATVVPAPYPAPAPAPYPVPAAPAAPKPCNCVNGTLAINQSLSVVAPRKEISSNKPVTTLKPLGDEKIAKRAMALHA